MGYLSVLLMGIPLVVVKDDYSEIETVIMKAPQMATVR
jgi:hypothetical protein